MGNSASMIKTDTDLTLVFNDGEPITIYPSNPRYDDIVVAVKNNDWTKVRELAIPAVQVVAQLNAASTTGATVKIEEGVVYYNGEPLHTTLANRMVSMLNDGFDIGPLALFLENLMENPSYRAVNELYTFLEKSKLPITDDGHFLAYKRVRSDWKDQYSGSVDNSIGQIPEIPRNKVDENPNNTCSDGLHFCARSYLSSYPSTDGGHVVVLKINPRDVVAIPTDYNNAKGRACRYEVLRELFLETDDNDAVPPETLEKDYEKLNEEESIRAISTANSDDVRIYSSLDVASQETGVEKSAIRRVLRGDRNSTGGFVWQYVTDLDTSDDVDQDDDSDWDDDWEEDSD